MYYYKLPIMGSYILLGLLAMTFSPVYSASKHGVVGFSRSLRNRVITDGVRVNAICPEFVDTALVNDSLAEVDEQTKSFIKDTGLLRYSIYSSGGPFYYYYLYTNYL